MDDLQTTPSKKAAVQMGSNYAEKAIRDLRESARQQLLYARQQ
jgi:hypothetical protein